MSEDKLSKLFSGIFNISPDSLEPTMTPQDIPQWDSLNHLRLITAVESEFKIRLSMQQIQQIKSLGDVREIVAGARSE